MIALILIGIYKYVIECYHWLSFGFIFQIPFTDTKVSNVGNHLLDIRPFNKCWKWPGQPCSVLSYSSYGLKDRKEAEEKGK